MYYHSGDDGDVIYSLASLRVVNNVDLRLTPSTNLVRSPYTPSKAERLACFVRTQPYIKSCEYASKQVRDEDPQLVNVDGFRWQYQIYNLIDWQSHYLGLGNITHEPWLVSPDIKEVEPVVIHRSLRYNNDEFPWRDILERFKNKIIMVGCENEHKEFCDKYGDVPYYQTKNFLELAQVIGGCQLFIGNQSSPMAVALGLGTRTIQEVCIWAENCVMRGRENIQYIRGNEDIKWEEISIEKKVEIEEISIEKKVEVKKNPVQYIANRYDYTVSRSLV